MIITKDNLYEVEFENQDAKLLIKDVVTSTSARLYYYHNIEITAEMALKIWHQAIQADEDEIPYSVSFLDYLNRGNINNTSLLEYAV